MAKTSRKSKARRAKPAVRAKSRAVKAMARKMPSSRTAVAKKTARRKPPPDKAAGNATTAKPIPITPELIPAHGLKPDEYQRILKLIGREPSFTELGIFS